MMATIVMALLVLLGIAWFFRDQIRVAYITYTLQHAQEGDPTDASDGGPTNNLPTPAPPPQSTTSTVVTKTTPPSAPAPPTSGATKSAPPSPPASGTAAARTPPQATPTDGPPVTVLPPLPVTPEDIKASTNRVDRSPAGSRKTESPVVLGPASNAVRVFDNATPETQGAVETLKRFLAANSWQEREKHVQMAEKVRPLMEQYYQLNPDGPIVVRQIQLMRHDKAPNTGGPPHCVFQVSGGDLKQPLPVMVEEEGNNWKVDWLTFTEFKDDLLQRFLESYQDEPKRFHVMMRRTHYFDEDVPGLDKLICFEIQPPMPGFAGHVFVRRGTPLAQSLDRNVGWEVSKAAAIVEIQWRKEGNQQWVELTDVPQYNWRNPAAGMAPVKAQLVE